MTSPTNFNQNALPHLLRLRDALWATKPNGRVSVMVGAGFSKNATPLDSTTGTMPDWYTLVMLLCQQLTASKDDQQRLMSEMGSVSEGYMRLAQYYEAKFGRAALDRFIRDSVADSLFQPGELHEKLLNLPWREVFTTNWDTLLERAADLRVDRLYFPVANDAQILTAGRPRITKLHGCVQRGGGYIFTEEDYRTYPQKHPAFVTVVRQALLEGPMVLIGFSGEDPNFRSWIGWMRDVLPSTHGIYLLDFSGSEMADFRVRRLQDQGVSVLQVGGRNVTYADSISEVLSFLRTQPSTDWEKAHRRAFSSGKFDKQEALISAAAESYPGWLICPILDRSSLFSSLPEELNNSLLESISLERRLKFLSQRARLLDIVGIGVMAGDGQVLDKVIFEAASDGTVSSELSDHWLNLVFSRLATARLDLDLKAYDALRTVLINSSVYKAKEVRNRLALSDAAMSLVKLDRGRAMEFLKSVDTSDPILHLRYLALMLELGGLSDAISSIDSVKRKVSKLARERPNDIRYASLDDVLRFLEKRILIASKPMQGNADSADDFQSQKRLGLRCDISGELFFLQTILDRPPSAPRSGSVTEPAFNAGTYKTTVTLSNELPVGLVPAYLATRCPDEVGLPIVIGTLRVISALLESSCAWLTMFDPPAGLALTLRLLSSGSIARVEKLTRADVAKLDSVLVKEAFSFTINAISRELKSSIRNKELLKGATILASKLVIRADAKAAREIWNIVFGGEWDKLIDTSNELLKARAEAIVESSHLLAEAEVRELLLARIRKLLVEPEESDSLPLLVVQVARQIDLEDSEEHLSEFVDLLVAALDSNQAACRRNGVYMLGVLSRLGVVGRQDRTEISRALWRNQGWPEINEKSKFVSNKGFFLFWAGDNLKQAYASIVSDIAAARDISEVVLYAELLSWRDDSEEFSSWIEHKDLLSGIAAKVLDAVLYGVSTYASAGAFGFADYSRAWRHVLGRLLAPIGGVDRETIVDILEKVDGSDLWSSSLILDLYRFGLVDAPELMVAISRRNFIDKYRWNSADIIFEIVVDESQKFEELGDRSIFLNNLSNRMTPLDGPGCAHAMWVAFRILNRRPDFVDPSVALAWMGAILQISRMSYTGPAEDAGIVPDLRRSAAALLHALRKAGKFERTTMPSIDIAEKSFAEDPLPEVRREVGA